MSGRLNAGKPLALAVGCATLGVFALLPGREAPLSPAVDTLPQAKACVALAIDRESGITIAVPCAGTQMLLAEGSSRTR